METAELLADAFERVRGLYVETARDLDPEVAHHRPQGVGNPIVWLLWHTARVQDDHVADLAGSRQAWHTSWAARFDLPFDESDIGYGHSSAEVGAVRVAALQDLVDYHEAVHQLTLEYLGRVDADELDRHVDDNWDPPVTAGVRLVSLLGDCLQHLGQAAYVRGLHASRA
jgi:hypothetical protein